MSAPSPITPPAEPLSPEPAQTVATGPVKIQLGARRERIALLVGILLLLGAGVPLLLALRPGAPNPRIQILAHRGASAYAPENTLAAFRVAIDQRADWLEMDVQQTADNQLVVFHDLRVERTTNGRGVVRELTLAQLRTLDAGAWFGPEFVGEQIPTFEEVVALAKAADIRIFPEVKDPRLYPGIEERVVDVLRRYDYLDRTIVQSFDGGSLEKIRAIEPRLRLAALYTRTNPLSGEPPARAEVIGPPFEIVIGDPSLVREAHGANRQVVVWAVDSTDPLPRLLDAGVDGIITGRPDLVRAALEGR
ncbi:MAG: glycerophosphodiester phosphodiesterase [Chloroflexi bacterium]|nr:glycerophosphodiester phosphodiesterase [Chloroflexota bacterium]